MFVFLTQILRLSRTPGYYAEAESPIQVSISRSIVVSPALRTGLRPFARLFRGTATFFLSLFNRLKEMAKERRARLGERSGNQSWMAGCKRPEDAQNPAFLQLSVPFTRSFGFLPSEREELSLYDHLRISFFLNFSNLYIIFTRRTLGIEDALWISVDPLYGNLSHRQCG